MFFAAWLAIQCLLVGLVVGHRYNEKRPLSQKRAPEVRKLQKDSRDRL
jgi:hypothetical protein